MLAILSPEQVSELQYLRRLSNALPGLRELLLAQLALAFEFCELCLFGQDLVFPLLHLETCQ